MRARKSLGAIGVAPTLVVAAGRAVVLAVCLTLSTFAGSQSGCSGAKAPHAMSPLLLFRVEVGAGQGLAAAPAETEVWIDGTYYIGALERGIRLQPGAHQVEIRHDDYHTAYFDVVLSNGQRRVLEVHLAEILP